MHGFPLNISSYHSPQYSLSADQKAGVVQPKYSNSWFYPPHNAGQQSLSHPSQYAAPPINPKFPGDPKWQCHQNQIKGKLQKKQIQLQNQSNKGAYYQNLCYSKSSSGFGQVHKNNQHESSISKKMILQGEQTSIKFSQSKSNAFGSFNGNNQQSGNNIQGPFNDDSFAFFSNNNLGSTHDSFGQPLGSFGSINNSFGSSHKISHLPNNTFTQKNINPPTFNGKFQLTQMAQPSKGKSALTSCNIAGSLQNIFDFAKPGQDDKLQSQIQVWGTTFPGSALSIKDLKKAQKLNTLKSSLNHEQSKAFNPYNLIAYKIKKEQSKQMHYKTQETQNLSHQGESDSNSSCHQSNYQSDQHNQQNKLTLFEQPIQKDKTPLKLLENNPELPPSVLDIALVTKQTQKQSLPKEDQKQNNQFCNSNQQKYKQKSESTLKSQDIHMNLDIQIKSQIYCSFDQPKEQGNSKKTQNSTITKLKSRIEQLQLRNNQCLKIIQNLSQTVKNFSSAQKYQTKPTQQTNLGNNEIQKDNGSN